VYAFFRYRAEKIAKKKAVETARVSMITKNLDSVTTNMEKNEKHRKAAAVAEAERRTAAAAAAAAKIKAAEDEKNEIAASKERVRKTRADVWKRLAGRFKVCRLSNFFISVSYFCLQSSDGAAGEAAAVQAQVNTCSVAELEV
jgi:hypothetical protein